MATVDEIEALDAAGRTTAEIAALTGMSAARIEILDGGPSPTLATDRPGLAQRPPSGPRWKHTSREQKAPARAAAARRRVVR